MSQYYVVVLNPCQECKENRIYYTSVLTKLWEQLTSNICCERLDFGSQDDGLPLSLFSLPELFFQMVAPKKLKNTEENEKQSNDRAWIDLTQGGNLDNNLKTMLTRLETIKTVEGIWSENVAEQLYKIADHLPYSGGTMLNVYWLICGHTECVNISNNVPLYGALKRLHMCHSANISWVFDTDNLSTNDDIYGTWIEDLDISTSNMQDVEEPLVDTSIVWHGSLALLEDQETIDNLNPIPPWNLSITYEDALLHISKADLNQTHHRVKENKVNIVNFKKGQDILKHNMTIICELGKVIPLWRTIPHRFILYHKSLMKQAAEVKRNSLENLGSFMDGEVTVLLASVEKTSQNISQYGARTTEDWINFVNTGVDNGKGRDRTKTTEAIYLLLYPREPGIFDAYFLRPESSFLDLYSMLCVYEASFPPQKPKKLLASDGEFWPERRWLRSLDTIHSVTASPYKSQFALAVHLDASEMLKYFTKDGKPLTKELEALRRQLEQKRKKSPFETEDIESDGTTSGIDYCSDNNPTWRNQASFSPKLLPRHVKHETLSICNTPSTLARAKPHGLKRKAKSESCSENNTDDSAEPGSHPLSNEQVQPRATREKQAKTHSKRRPLSLTKKTHGELTDKKKPQKQKREITTKDPKTDCSSSEDVKPQKKKKRRSFDGSEISLPLDPKTKEKRSDRHKRRLARVVKASLKKYGVDPGEEYFETCSERLYYLCKSFLKDLKTSEGLNNEMKRLAESNVANVVEFEKRRRAAKPYQSES